MADRASHGRPWVRPALAGLAVALLLGTVAMTTIGGLAAASAARPSESVTVPDRVLILALPRLTWADLVAARPPNLLRLLDRSAVASAATRAIGGRTSLAEGYLTIGTGNRAAVDDRDGALAFAPDEPYGSVTAGEEYERRTGRPPDGAVVQVAIDEITATNERYLYDTEPGALGRTLAAAGKRVAVVGNADTGLDAWQGTGGPDGGPRTGSHREPANILADDPADAATAGAVQRPVALGLMDAQGLVPDGDVSHDLLAAAPGQPFGVEQDRTRTLATFDQAWSADDVVLVELSDLERADAEGASAGAERSAMLRRRALGRVDRLLGDLLDQVTDDDLVVLVSPAAPRAAEEPTPFAMAGHGVEPGITESGTTRRSGYVTLTDIAPTILDRLHVDAHDSMSGAAISERGSGRTGLGRYRALAERNEVTAFRDHAAGPISVYYLCIQIAAWCLVAFSFLLPFRWSGWLRPVGRFLALVSLAFPTVVFLFGIGRLDALGRPGYAATLTAVAVVLAVGAELTRRLPLRVARWPLLGPPVTLVALLWLVLVVDGLTGANLQIDTIFGYSPVVAGRFAGYGNMAFALLAISGVVLATATWALTPDERRQANPSQAMGVAAAVLGVTIVVDGFPAFGSDVGGVLCLVPASAVVLVLLSARRPRGRTVALVAGGLVLALAAFVAYDLSRPAAEQSHLGRFVSAVFGSDDGGAGTTIHRKAAAAWATLDNAAVMWVVPIAVAVLAVAIWRRWGFIGRLIDTVPGMLACLWASVVLAVLGGVLNDSGVWVPAMMVPIFLGYLLSIVVAPTGSEATHDVAPAPAVDRATPQVEPTP